MRSRLRTAERRKWPFWLLLAAWVCANSPQVAVYALLTWAAEARTFTHQRELTREVAHLLAGQKAEGRVERALAQMKAEMMEEDEGRKGVAGPTSAPTMVVLKKVDLAEEETIAVAAVDVLGNFGYDDDGEFGRARRVAPPHGPPRVSLG